MSEATEEVKDTKPQDDQVGKVFKTKEEQAKLPQAEKPAEPPVVKPKFEPQVLKKPFSVHEDKKTGRVVLHWGGVDRDIGQVKRLTFQCGVPVLWCMIGNTTSVIVGTETLLAFTEIKDQAQIDVVKIDVEKMTASIGATIGEIKLVFHERIRDTEF